MRKLFKPNFIIFLLSFFILPVSGNGKDLGIQGELFPIEEENFLLFLKKQLSSQSSKGSIQSIQERLENLAKHPRCAHIPSEAVHSRVWYYDPTFIAPQTIRDTRGRIIAKKGSKINPLKTITLSSGLLFLDGDNPAHIQWARIQIGSFKWILVHGDPFRLEHEQKRSIYFDQNGFSISKFGIQQIPARVTQEGECLKIEEIALVNEETSGE